MKAIVQEAPMGCAVACVSSLVGKSYSEVLRSFDKDYTNTRGYYCNEIIKVLAKLGESYVYRKVNWSTKKYLRVEGTIVFIRRSKRCPEGHYLLKTRRGWMDSWINLPKINSAKAGFRRKLPGKPQWILYKQ